MDKYKNTIEEILKNTSIPKENIFDYEFSPYKDEFNLFFEFYFDILNNNYYGINPALLFFKNEFSTNAAAGVENGYYIVSINMGTVNYLINKLKKKDLLNDTHNDEFIEFEKLLDVSVNELMYQNAMHFTFYHEMAHLIQKSDLLKEFIFEQPNNEKEFSMNHHILELDADKFSSLSIGAHTFQYVKKIFGKELTNDKLEKTLILICSSVLFYILSFETNKCNLYYKEKTHPHPIIRISCIIVDIVGYVTECFKEKEYIINVTNVMNKCLDFSNKISIKHFDDVHIENYKKTLSNEYLNVVKYLKEIEKAQHGNKSLSSHKWNLVASVLHS